MKLKGGKKKNTVSIEAVFSVLELMVFRAILATLQSYCFGHHPISRDHRCSCSLTLLSWTKNERQRTMGSDGFDSDSCGFRKRTTRSIVHDQCVSTGAWLSTQPTRAIGGTNGCQYRWRRRRKVSTSPFFFLSKIRMLFILSPATKRTNNKHVKNHRTHPMLRL